MQVTSTTANPSLTAAANTSAASSNTLNYSQFLTLLVTQMQNQDPLSPQDPTQYVSQLASFSAVEQQVNTNTKLDSIISSNTIVQAEGLIGQTVTSADGSLSGTVASVTITTSGATATLSNGSQVTIGPGTRIGA